MAKEMTQHRTPKGAAYTQRQKKYAAATAAKIAKALLSSQVI